MPTDDAARRARLLQAVEQVEARKGRIPTMKQRVLAAVQAEPGSPLAEVSSRAGLSLKTTRERLSVLVRDRAVRRTGGMGRYANSRWWPTQA